MPARSVVNRGDAGGAGERVKAGRQAVRDFQADGSLKQRDLGSPQGSAISPVLANLFLHYALDMWLGREFPAVPFERYADDVILHCKTQQQAQIVLDAIIKRLATVG